MACGEIHTCAPIFNADTIRRASPSSQMFRWALKRLRYAWRGTLFARAIASRAARSAICGSDSHAMKPNAWRHFYVILRREISMAAAMTLLSVRTLFRLLDALEWGKWCVFDFDNCWCQWRRPITHRGWSWRSYQYAHRSARKSPLMLNRTSIVISYFAYNVNEIWWPLGSIWLTYKDASCLAGNFISYDFDDNFIIKFRI